MLDHGEIGIHKPINTIRGAALLALIQLSASNGSRHTFLPTHICQSMDRYYNH